MDLEIQLLETLRGRGGGQGLTHGELREKCGPAWRRELARQAGLEGEEATLAVVKDFVYRLWERGRVVIEPPAGEGKAVRVWPPGELGTGAGAAGSPDFNGGSDSGEDLDRIAQVYERLSREGRSPYVFLSRLRAETGLSIDVLHRTLRKQQEAGRAVLSIGDWSAATEEERAAVLEADGRNYIKVRLVAELRRKEHHGKEN